MQNLVELAPVLGAYDRIAGLTLDAKSMAFGNMPRARYAAPMNSGALVWNSEERAGAAVLAPSGRVDEASADEFKAHLLDAMAAKPSAAIIDLSSVEYMSSRGLRALTLAQRAGQEAGTTIILAAPNEVMREILAISRYDMVFRVADTVEEALGH